MDCLVQRVVLRYDVWMDFLSKNQDLVMTGWELVESPELNVVDEYMYPYDGRIAYLIVYSDREITVWEDEVERFIVDGRSYAEIKPY